MATTPSNASTLPGAAQVAAAQAEETCRYLDRIERKLDEVLAYLKAQGPPVRKDR